jgi:CHAT domain-containing protein
MRLVRCAGLALLAAMAACEAEDPVRRLARSTPGRLLEARLSGPFPAGGCPVAGPSAPPTCPFPEVGTAAFEALANASPRPGTGTGVADRRAAALSELIWSAGGVGSARAATEALAELAAEGPGDVAILSDWAAAELTRSTAEDLAYPDVLALEATERALRIDSLHEPARFNRALALDRLGFGDLAARGWSAYLAIDSTSEWAGEARRRREVLEGEPPRAGIQPRLDREAVLDSLLPAWGRALLAGDSGQARLLLDRAGDRASGLAARSPSRAVDDVRRIGATSPEARARMAGALARFGLGREHYRAGRDSAAAVHLEAARDDFALLSRDLEDWASVWIASVDLARSRHGEVEARTSRILDRHLSEESPVLVGLAGWLRGVAAGRRGQYAVALGHYQGAAEAMERSGEAGYTAFLWTLVAEARMLLGNPAGAWESRRRSLEVFRGADNPGLLRAALTPAVEDLKRAGLFHAALHLQNYAVTLSEAGMAANLLSEDLVRRATLLMDLDRPLAARADLDRARQAAGSAESSEARRWSMAQVWAAEAALAGRVDDGTLAPEAARNALTLLDSASSFFRERGIDHSLVDLHLERSRLHGGRGAPGEARQALDSALTLVERTRSTIQDPSQALRFAESSRRIWDRGLHLDLVARRDPWSALRLMERIRRLTTPWVDFVLDDMPGEMSALPESLAVVAYASVQDTLFAWVLRRDGAEALALPVSRARLNSAIHGLNRGARQARAPEELRRASATLSDLLLPDTIRALLGERDVAFVPGPLLAGLPFSALSGRTGWLIEERAVSVAPSLALLLSRVREDRAPAARQARGALIVADPTVHQTLTGRYPSLPGARRELEALRSLYPEAVVLEGGAADPGALLQGLSRPLEVLHFAGHAVSAQEAPEGSHLVLAPLAGEEAGGSDMGLLYAHDLARSGFAGPDLVVLTACSSVAPRPGSLGGFQGIALPFLERGTAAVLGTLWEIEDDGASRVAARFHEGWVEGLSAAEALRRAQLDALRGGDTPARVWTAFQLVGAAGNPRSGSVPVPTTTTPHTGEY